MELGHIKMLNITVLTAVHGADFAAVYGVCLILHRQPHHISSPVKLFIYILLIQTLLICNTKQPLFQSIVLHLVELHYTFGCLISVVSLFIYAHSVRIFFLCVWSLSNIKKLLWSSAQYALSTWVLFSNITLSASLTDFTSKIKSDVMICLYCKHS